MRQDIEKVLQERAHTAETIPANVKVDVANATNLDSPGSIYLYASIATALAIGLGVFIIIKKRGV